MHPKVVQEQLGHATIAVTMDIHSHVPQAVRRESAGRIAGLFELQAVAFVERDMLGWRRSLRPAHCCEVCIRRPCEFGSGRGEVRHAGSCLVGSRFGVSCARPVGGHTPLQVSPDGKPGGPDQSVGCDLFVRVPDGYLRKPDEASCLGVGRVRDVFGIATGHGPWSEFGERADVEADVA